VTGAAPAARSAVQRLVLVTLLLAGALSLLGAVSLDLTRAVASGPARDGGAAGPGGDRARGTGAQASSVRGVAESGPQAARSLLRAAPGTAGAVVVPGPETGAEDAAAPVVLRLLGTAPAHPSLDVPPARQPAGASDRAPPRTAGT